VNGEVTVGLMRNLGQFVGHLVAGIRSDPRAEKRERVVVDRRVDERENAEGVVLRRTVIEEVELPGAPTRPASERRPNGGAAESNDHAS